MNRRQFLFSAMAASAEGADAPQPQTHIYKRAAGCEIKADVWGSGDGAPRPLAVWIHGGALIGGSRKLSPKTRVLRTLLDSGFAVISIDYRLAPETKLPDIIRDVQDAFGWMRKEAKTLGVDTRRLVVCGGSAGGYLTLMTGFSVNPRPKAIVSYWGYGDIVGPWYSKPDPFYLTQPAVSRQEALASVGRDAVSDPPEKTNRFRFYLHCRQQGIWPKEVAGHDPATEDRWFTPYCPIRNVTRAYPPSMLVHGTADTDVPYEQSRMMAERLQKTGVEHRLVTVPDGSHGLGNIKAEEQDRIYREAAGFLRSHV
ncbi:MAG: alpha/beta hydrolase [Bryobacteraceae bacterium]